MLPVMGQMGLGGSQEEGGGHVACQAGTEPTKLMGVSLKEGRENLLTSPSTLNWRPCMQKRRAELYA